MVVKMLPLLTKVLQ